MDDTVAEATVKYRWFNQNPFNSMFWAVQGMAAEFTTGVLMMDQIKQSGKPISMLVANNKATFTKKARGRIRFCCEDGALIKTALERAIATGEGQTLWMTARGTDEEGDVVSIFDFEWTVRLRR